MIKQFIISTLVIIPVATTSAQQKQSLRQCMDMAVANNYGIKAAEKGVERQKALQGTAWDLEKTELSLSQDPTSGGSPDNAITLSQQIDFPTVYVAKSKLLKAETQAERNKAEINKQQLRGDVAALYYQMMYQQEYIHILQRQDSVLTRFCSIAAKRYEAGETRQLEKLTAERRLMDNRQKTAQANGEMKALQLRMAVLLNSSDMILPADCRLEKIQVSQSGMNFAQTVEGQYALSLVNVADREVAVAKNGYAPSLSVALRNQLVISSWNPYNQDRSRFNGGNFMGFEVGVGIPLFFGSTKAKVKAAKRSREMAEMEMKQNMAQRMAEHAELEKRIREAGARTDYYCGEGKTQSENMARLAAMEYENGEIPYTEYIAVIDDNIEQTLTAATAINDYNQLVISQLRLTDGIEMLGK